MDVEVEQLQEHIQPDLQVPIARQLGGRAEATQATMRGQSSHPAGDTDTGSLQQWLLLAWPQDR